MCAVLMDEGATTQRQVMASATVIHHIRALIKTFTAKL